MYELRSDVAPGRHVLTVRVDNKPTGDPHPIRDQTRTNWHGILGRVGASVDSIVSNVGAGLPRDRSGRKAPPTARYDPVKLSATTIKAGETISVSRRVTNAGSRAGDEVVQLYLRDDYTSAINFDQLLRGFERIHLAPDESREVSFTFAPQHLQLYDARGEWVVEPGRFTVMVGASSPDIRAHRTFVVTDAEARAPTEAPVADDWLDGR